MNNKNTLGLIPARGGSKGIRNKNIRDLNGQPLIAYSIQAGQQSNAIDSVVVSTDDDEIAEVAERYGARVPFMRPDELATDEAPTAPVVTHAIETLRAENESYDSIVLLQPTSPLRTAEHIDEAYTLFQNDHVDSVISAYKTYSTRWQQTPDGAEKLNYNNASPRRQDRDPEYIVNGAIYIADVSLYLETEDLKAGHTAIYTMDELDSIDIDTPVDLWLAEQILSKWRQND